MSCSISRGGNVGEPDGMSRDAERVFGKPLRLSSPKLPLMTNAAEIRRLSF
jgi:hypothetical protein